MQNYEKLGAFYLGRVFDRKAGETLDEVVLYDAKDLTTHAVCVGMTGSGKTGLCLGLLEEAAIDGIPVIAIDPKGDLGNLCLTFPELRPEDFEPWIDADEAKRKNRTPAEQAAKTADLWREGLGQWDQDGARIQRFRDAVDLAIYTPGSSAGLSLTVLRSFAAPRAELLEDGDALRERVLAATSGLLALLGIDADPIRSREHILIANLLERAWRDGRDVAIADLIHQIQEPPFTRIGVLDIEAFYPAKERFALAMTLNNLLASPGFAAWMEGEPLDIARLLWTPAGKPRISILSIAHLSEPERMFFVTILLNEVVAWMRTQPGTTSLRALLYMDEVFGYFPPSANPPSKMPMLTLLKQARAFGLGCVLATQNPVDLDYKGLSNAGTWFLGRLQTERDKMRVLEGLEGASSTAGAKFDRAEIEATLAGLQSRCFLMNNVHDSGPVLFQTRWVLSYLRGPLTRTQIGKLMSGRKAEPATAPASPTPTPAPPKAAHTGARRPVLPPQVDDFVLPLRGAVREGDRLVYRPALLGTADVHFVAARQGVDVWRKLALLAPLDDDERDDPWAEAAPLTATPELEAEADTRGEFDALPADAGRAASYKKWTTRFKDHIYRTQTVSVWTCDEPKAVSEPGDSEGDFRARLALLAREARDDAVEALRKRYAPKSQRLVEQIREAEQRVGKEKAQYREQKVETAVSFGKSLLGAIFGRKVGRASSTVSRVSRAARERGDVIRAEEDLEARRRQLADLEREFEKEAEELQESFRPDALKVEEVSVPPRKSDISIDRVALVWCPWRVAEGKTEALF